MSVLLLRLRGWWAHLCGRAGPPSFSPPLASRPVLPAPLPPIEPAPSPETVAASPAEEPPASAEPEAAPEQSLLETLQLTSLDEKSATPGAIDPALRERTRAALASLRQIPALQSFAQGFVKVTSDIDTPLD